MVTGRATIENDAGIHVRPSGIIYAAVRGYPGTVGLRSGGRETILTNVMGLIALGLDKGDVVEIEVDGPDEAEKLAELKELFERHFDFAPRG